MTAPEIARKRAIRDQADDMAAERERWIERNAYYYGEDHGYTRFLVPPGLRVLDLGCGTGRLLAALKPSRGVGVDFSPAMVDEARRRHPDLEFHVGDVEDPDVLDRVGGPFDVILLSDTVGLAGGLRGHPAPAAPAAATTTPGSSSPTTPGCGRRCSQVGQRVGQQMPQPEPNWLSADDLAGILDLADFEVVRARLPPGRCPSAWAASGPLVNRFVGHAARRLPAGPAQLPGGPVGGPPSRSPAVGRRVVIPCRNEAGNVGAGGRADPAASATTSRSSSSRATARTTPSARSSG